LPSRFSPNTVARTHQFRIIGNAVPPLVGEAVGLEVRSFLDVKAARKLRAIIQEMRFVDLRRRQRLLALADGFDQSAARIEEQSLPKAAD
jgi:hypothetical protein